MQLPHPARPTTTRLRHLRLGPLHHDAHQRRAHQDGAGPGGGNGSAPEAVAKGGVGVGLQNLAWEVGRSTALKKECRARAGQVGSCAGAAHARQAWPPPALCTTRAHLLCRATRHEGNVSGGVRSLHHAEPLTGLQAHLRVAGGRQRGEASAHQPAAVGSGQQPTLQHTARASPLPAAHRAAQEPRVAGSN